MVLRKMVFVLGCILTPTSVLAQTVDATCMNQCIQQMSLELSICWTKYGMQPTPGNQTLRSACESEARAKYITCSMGCHKPE
jgi:hypothetical protein